MKVPFITNTPDDKHCVPVAYMMIIKAFDPAFSMSIEEWSELAGYEEGKGTWANGSLLWLDEHGYEVKHINYFDYPKFVEKQDGYLLELAGEEVGQWMIDHTNMQAEVERTKQLIAAGTIIEKRVPTQQDIRQYLDDGYLLRINVNYAKLAGRDGYVGHSIVIFDYDDSGVHLHDPGLPAIENRHVSWGDLEAAWADPTPDNKELDAIRKK